MHPVAHLPFVLGVLRRLEVATGIDRLIPPHPAHGLSCGRGVAALGVSGAGGLPLRLGLRAGTTSDSVETPGASEACLALGLEGVHGIVADRKAASRRTVGLCLAQGRGLVTLVPRPWAGRHALEAWGQQHPALPLCVEKPGRTKAAACRQWHGPSVIRPGEVEDSEGRVTQEALRVLVVPSRPLAQQPIQTYASAPGKAAEALTDHGQRVHARWCAGEAEAAAGLAEEEPHGPGHRGRPPRPWRSPVVRSRVVAASRPLRRARRGHPAQTDAPPLEAGSRLGGEGEALAPPGEDQGWTGLAPPVRAEGGAAVEVLQAY
jgi:hypothetical protein